MEPWLKPMLCGSADAPPTGPDWVLEGKLDGWRLVAHVQSDKNVRVFGGRNGNEYTNQLPYVQDALAACLPPDSAVDGELVGLAWGNVQSVMTSGEPVKGKPVKVVLFDVLRLDGQDVRSLPWYQRRILLDQVQCDGDVVLISPYGPCTQEAHEAMLAAGLEGSVCKLRTSRYVNTRSSAWVKVKPQQTAEAKVVGFKPGTRGSSFGDLVGALELQMLDSGARTRASGFDMKTRKHITEHPDLWLNTVVEIKHHGLSAAGVPRHPQFLRRRDDRAAAPKKAKTRTTTKEARMAPPVRRNYGAMGDAKLLKVIGELRNGGDAAHRAIAKGFAVEEDLQIAQAIAEQRGLAARAS